MEIAPGTGHNDARGFNSPLGRQVYADLVEESGLTAVAAELRGVDGGLAELPCTHGYGYGDGYGYGGGYGDGGGYGGGGLSHAW